MSNELSEMPANQPSGNPGQSEPGKVTNPWSLLAFSIQLAVNKFGPYAFGLISVMILYFGLFKPQIDSLIVRDQTRDSLLEAMVNQTLSATESAERAAEDSKTAAESNRATVAIMERILSNVTRAANDGQ
jgi:hypothetical protein